MIKSLLLLLLVACSSISLPDSARLTQKTFSNPQEARNHIKNRFNYLHLLFEQSLDPYYGTPKWDAPCLAQNSIGPLLEKDGSIWFVSHMLTNENGDVGFCRGMPVEIILLHCPDEKKAFEIRCPPGDCEKIISCSLIPSNRSE